MSLTYKQFIEDILNTRGRFNCEKGYCERHHIVPKCLGGTNEKDNLIDLFAKEHFEAHRLLVLEHPNNCGLQYAWWNMCQIAGNKFQSRYVPTPAEYEEARKVCAEISSERVSGEKHPMFGQHHTKETKEKMSKSHEGKHAGENNPMFGKKHTEEQKKMVSEWSKEWHKNNKHPMTGVRRCGKEAPMYGKHLSEETKQILREKNIGSNNANAKRILCDGEIYDTLKEFCDKYGLKSSTVSSWLHGRNPLPEKWQKKGLSYYRD